MDNADPSFATFVEPPELQRERCARCVDALATVHCNACAQPLCAPCEQHVHALEYNVIKRERSAKERAEEESKGDAAQQHVHHTHVAPFNLCQICDVKTPAFVCVDCKTYQCDGCCAARHLGAAEYSAHLYFCVDGAASNLLRYARWSPAFVDMAKMQTRVKRQAIEDARAAAAAIKREAVAVGQDDDTSATLQAPRTIPRRLDLRPSPPPSDAATELAPFIKTERVTAMDPTTTATPTAAAEPTQDMQALSLAEVPDASPLAVTAPAAPSPTAQAPAAPALQPQLSVTAEPPVIIAVLPSASPPPAPTLTPSASPPPPAVASVAPAVAATTAMKGEQPMLLPTRTAPAGANFVVDLTEDDDDDNDTSSMKHEPSAWLAAATASAMSTNTHALASAVDSSSSRINTDNDIVKPLMVNEYNRLCEAMFNHEQAIAAVQTRLMALFTSDMNAVTHCRDEIARIQRSIQQAAVDRDKVVAGLVVYLHRDAAALQTLLDGTYADEPHLQQSCHTRCAQLEAEIRAKRKTIHNLKRGMDDAARMKKDASETIAEVTRLSAMIVANEDAVRVCEVARLDELVRLFQYSENVRNAAREIAPRSTSDSR